MMENELYRDALQAIDPYIPGKSMEDVKNEYNLDAPIRLASNENRFGPSPKATQAAKEAMIDTHLYPDSTAKILRKCLAELYGVHSKQVMTANGADEVLSLLIAAYINDGDEVIYGTPTFPTYRSETLLMGGIPKEVPLTKEWKYDLNKMLDMITNKTKMIIICNPNNPTGTIVLQEELADFINKVPNNVLVVMDEAYIEYHIQQIKYLTSIDLFKQSFDNLITVRTFSKFYGLAGLRVGYAIGLEQHLEPIQRIRPPFATNRPAIEAAVQAIKDKAFSSKHIPEMEEQKAYLEKELTKIGFTVIPSATNFLFVHVKKDATDLFEQLLYKGIIIRPCAPWGLPEYARITIGTKEQNDKLIYDLKNMV